MVGPWLETRAEKAFFIVRLVAIAALRLAVGRH
jgi:hypothetical protein